MSLWQNNLKTVGCKDSNDDYSYEPAKTVIENKQPVYKVNTPSSDIVTQEDNQELLENIFSSSVIDIDKMSEELAPYIAMAKRVSKANEGTAPTIIEHCADGMSKISLYRAKATTNYNLAKAKRKEVESRVMIQEFNQWALETGNKNTDKMREIFSNQHKDVLTAKKNEAEAEGLLSFLDSSYQLFVMSLSAVKAIVYGYRASDSMSGQYKTTD